MNRRNDPPPGQDDGEAVSKTRRKKEMLALQHLGEKLTTLPASQLEKCQLPPELAHAIAEYKRIPNRHGARKRQLQFIGRLMREVDVDPIVQVLDKEGEQVALDKRRFQRLEALRDRLLAGDQAVLDEVIRDNPGMDIQYLRQLIRQASKEAGAGKPPAAARKLFVFLRELE